MNYFTRYKENNYCIVTGDCGIFESLSYHQEDEVIDTTIFAATVVLVNIIKKLVSSNFMGTVSSFSVIFDTGATY